MVYPSPASSAVRVSQEEERGKKMPWAKIDLQTFHAPPSLPFVALILAPSP